MSPITHLTAQYRKVVSWFVTKRDNRIWAERLNAALAKLPTAEHKWMKPILENHIRYSRMAIASAAPSYHQVGKQSLEKFEQTKINIVVSVLRELIPLTEIIGVQPMHGPVGQVSRLAYTQQEDTSTIRLSLVNQTVEACTRKLRTHIPVEPAKGHIPANIPKDVEEMVGVQIAHEIVEEVLNDLKRISANKASFDGASYATSVESTQMAAIKINMIAAGTKRGAGNFIVVSPIMVSYLQQCAPLKFAPHAGSQFSALTRVGTIHGTIRVYMSYTMHSKDDQEEILIGYNGSGSIDSGYYYCPYVVLMCSGAVIDPHTFMPLVTFMTRHGKSAFVQSETQPVADSGSYYGVLTFDNPMGADPFAVDLPSKVVEDASVVSDNNA